MGKCSAVEGGNQSNNWIMVDSDGEEVKVLYLVKQNICVEGVFIIRYQTLHFSRFECLWMQIVLY